jgi:lipopolysaccharide/colanic/teichoic acid biosynthesis glycosyltransferase
MSNINAGVAAVRVASTQPAFRDIHTLLASDPATAWRELETILVNPYESFLYMDDLEVYASDRVTSHGLDPELRRRVMKNGLRTLFPDDLSWVAFDLEALADLHVEIMADDDPNSYWGQKRLGVEAQTPGNVPCLSVASSVPHQVHVLASSAENIELFSIPSIPVDAKRVLDIVLSSIFLVVSAPVILLALIMIYITSRGPTVYAQTRVGYRGRIFTIYKIRTMYQDSERRCSPRWSIPGDPRVTPFGRFLRWSHIDELPQLINVLKGEMSLVGPRPERPEFIDQLERAMPNYRHRLTVRPGLTGLAQVMQAPDTDLGSVRSKLIYDLHYINHMSIIFDVRILLATMFHLPWVPHSMLRWFFCLPDSATCLSSKNLREKHAGKDLGAIAASAAWTTQFVSSGTGRGG